MGIAGSTQIGIEAGVEAAARVAARALPADGAAVEFDSILRRRREAASPDERARAAAEEFVAQALVLPVLKGLREQNGAAPPFQPGPYERSIGALFDAEIASEIVRSERFSIVDAVARNLLRVADRGGDEAPTREHGGSNDGRRSGSTWIDTRDRGAGTGRGARVVRPGGAV